MGKDGPLTEAVNDALAASGEDLDVWDDGIMSYTPDVLKPRRRPGRDRRSDTRVRIQGSTRHVSPAVRVALALARGFAANEPNTVLTYVDVQERKYETELRDPAAAISSAS